MRQVSLLIILSLIIAFSCQTINAQNKDSKAKYVFLFIGDGMGLQQVNASQVYIDSVLKDKSSLSFINFPVQSFATTYAANQNITCSAAAGTALSTGSKTSIGTLGLNYNHTDTLYSIAKKIKEYGLKVGILTSVSIDHATPAAFYAHQGSRGSSYDIAKDLLKSGYDLFAGGGFLDPYGKELNTNVESIYSLGNKYSVGFTSTLTGIDSLRNKYKTIVYSAAKPASESTLKYAIDNDHSDITLAELTQKAIQTLDNPKGFFMMVEGGKIDWACHSNDAATAIHEVRAFSDAVSQAVEFSKIHPNETLIIVTADHETGGFSLGNRDNKYTMKLSYLKNQRMSMEELQVIVGSAFKKTPKPSLDEMLVLIKEKTGLGDSALGLALTDKELKQVSESYSSSITPKSNTSPQKSKYLAEPQEIFTSTCIDILDRKAAIGWTSTSHTGSPVPVFVMGEGQALFNGRIDNTDIPKNILKSIGIN